MNSKKQHIETLTTETTEFRREIGVFGGVSIIVGIMVGSGIFYQGAMTINRVGMNCGLALLCWVIGGLISLMGGLCYAELGTAMPKAGGRLIYLNEAFHPVVGFTAGFTDWLIGGPGSIAAVAIANITVLKSFTDMSDFGVKIASIVLIVALTAWNLLGVKAASFFQNLSLLMKIIPILIVMVAALIAGHLSPDLSLSSASTYASQHNTSVFSMMAIAIVACLWSYEGWSNLNTVAEEIRNPKKNIPRALIIGIGGVMILYTLFNYAILRVLPHSKIVELINDGNYYIGTEAARMVLGNTGAVIVTMGMVLAMFGTMNGMILAQPRMYYAMAAEGHFFKSFSKLSPRTKVPTVPIIVQGILSVALVMARNLDQLTNMVVLSAMIYNLLVIVAVPILRHKYPDIERPYKVWFYPVTVIIMIVLYAFLIYETAVDDPVTGIVGLSVPFIGALVYYIFDVKNKKVQ